MDGLRCLVKAFSQAHAPFLAPHPILPVPRLTLPLPRALHSLTPPLLYRDGTSCYLLALALCSRRMKVSRSSLTTVVTIAKDR